MARLEFPFGWAARRIMAFVAAAVWCLCAFAEPTVPFPALPDRDHLEII